MDTMPESRVTLDIHATHHYQGVGLPMWVLYDHPSDMPDHYVLRLWDGMTNTPTTTVFPASTLEEIEAQIDAVPGRFVRMERFTDDDPKILAVFL